MINLYTYPLNPGSYFVDPTNIGDGTFALSYRIDELISGNYLPHANLHPVVDLGQTWESITPEISKYINYFHGNKLLTNLCQYDLHQTPLITASVLLNSWDLTQIDSNYISYAGESLPGLPNALFSTTGDNALWDGIQVEISNLPAPIYDQLNGVQFTYEGVYTGDWSSFLLKWPNGDYVDFYHVAEETGVSTISPVTINTPLDFIATGHELVNGMPILADQFDGPFGLFENGNSWYAKVIDANTVQLARDAGLTDLYSDWENAYPNEPVDFALFLDNEVGTNVDNANEIWVSISNTIVSPRAIQVTPGSPIDTVLSNVPQPNYPILFLDQKHVDGSKTWYKLCKDPELTIRVTAIREVGATGTGFQMASDLQQDASNLQIHPYMGIPSHPTSPFTTTPEQVVISSPTQLILDFEAFQYNQVYIHKQHNDPDNLSLMTQLPYDQGEHRHPWVLQNTVNGLDLEEGQGINKVPAHLELTQIGIDGSGRFHYEVTVPTPTSYLQEVSANKMYMDNGLKHTTWTSVNTNNYFAVVPTADDGSVLDPTGGYMVLEGVQGTDWDTTWPSFGTVGLQSSGLGVLQQDVTVGDDYDSVVTNAHLQETILTFNGKPVVKAVDHVTQLPVTVPRAIIADPAPATYQDGYEKAAAQPSPKATEDFVTVFNVEQMYDATATGSPIGTIVEIDYVGNLQSSPPIYEAYYELWNLKPDIIASTYKREWMNGLHFKAYIQELDKHCVLVFHYRNGPTIDTAFDYFDGTYSVPTDFAELKLSFVVFDLDMVTGRMGNALTIDPVTYPTVTIETALIPMPDFYDETLITPISATVTAVDPGVFGLVRCNIPDLKPGTRWGIDTTPLVANTYAVWTLWPTDQFVSTERVYMAALLLAHYDVNAFPNWQRRIEQGAAAGPAWRYSNPPNGTKDLYRNDVRGERYGFATLSSFQTWEEVTEPNFILYSDWYSTNQFDTTDAIIKSGFDLFPYTGDVGIAGDSTTGVLTEIYDYNADGNTIATTLDIPSFVGSATIAPHSSEQYPRYIDSIALRLGGSKRFEYIDQFGNPTPFIDWNTYFRAGSAYEQSTLDMGTITLGLNGPYLDSATLGTMRERGKYPSNATEIAINPFTYPDDPLGLPAPLVDDGTQWLEFGHDPRKVWPAIPPRKITANYNMPSTKTTSGTGIKHVQPSGQFKWQLEFEYPPLTQSEFEEITYAANAVRGSAMPFYLPLIYNGERILWNVNDNVPKVRFRKEAIDDNSDTTIDVGAKVFLIEGFAGNQVNAIQQGEVMNFEPNVNGGLNTVVNTADANVFGEVQVAMVSPIEFQHLNGDIINKAPDNCVVTLSQDAFTYTRRLDGLYDVVVAFNLDRFEDGTAPPEGGFDLY